MKRIALTLLLACAGARAQEDYSTWLYHADIGMNTTATGANVPADQVGFPVLVRLTPDQGLVFAQALPDGADLRVAKSDGTHFPYQIERWDALNQVAEMWVLVDTVKGDNGTQSFTLYWGNPTAVDSSNGTVVFDSTNGFAAVWHMNNGGIDATRNLNNGTDAGTQDTAGVIGRARNFDTVLYSQIVVPHSTSLDITASITLSAWVHSGFWGPWGPHPDPSFGNRRILQKAGDGQAYALREQTDHDTLQFDLGGPAGNTAIVPDPAVGEWHLLHATYDGVNSQIYLDGAVQVTEPATGPITSTVGDLSIGSKPGSGALRDFFLGDMDEIRVQHAARDLNWVKLEYANQGPTPTLLIMPAPTSVRGSKVPASGFSARSSANGVEFRLPQHGRTRTLSILDMRGNVVSRQNVLPGNRVATWNGSRAMRGVYVARLTGIGASALTAKVLLTR